LELNAEESARTFVGQNSTQNPQALHRSTTMETTPLAIPTSFLAAGEHRQFGALPASVMRETKFFWSRDSASADLGCPVPCL
jgi:hypothetical protein